MEKIYLSEANFAHHLLEHYFLDGTPRGCCWSYQNRTKSFAVRYTIHVGQQGDAGGAEDDRHDPDAHKLLL